MLRKLTVLAAFAISGCVSLPQYDVGVNGFTPEGREALPLTTRIFLAANPKAENPLLDGEVRRKLGAELIERGYRLTTADSADVFVMVDLGIGTPRQIADEQLVYVPGTTSTVSAPTGATVATVKSSGRLTSVPSSSTVYDRWLTLTAFDAQTLRDNKGARILWRGEATSTGSSSDLRTVANIMLVPTLENFGKNTAKRLTYSIGERDDRVVRIMAR